MQNKHVLFSCVYILPARISSVIFVYQLAEIFYYVVVQQMLITVSY